MTVRTILRDPEMDLWYQRASRSTVIIRPKSCERRRGKPFLIGSQKQTLSKPNCIVKGSNSFVGSACKVVKMGTKGYYLMSSQEEKQTKGKKKRNLKFFTKREKFLKSSNDVMTS